MGTLEILMLRGRSGAVYPFRVYVLPADLPNAGAVVVCSKRTLEEDGRGTHKLIHISQTWDLADSLSNYKTLPCFKEYHANCVCIYLDEDERHRTMIEGDLMSYYYPPCNNYPHAEHVAQGPGKEMP